MKMKFEKNKLIAKIAVSGFALVFLFFQISCTEIQSPKSEPFYGEVKIPIKQEFRWSNGKMPKTLDPAFAVGSPETDVVRAVFEGLTETDAKTLKAIPAIATKWTASEDKKTWTFQLRRDAKWSNEKPVTASDFVSSWKRLAAFGGKISHPSLLKNIAGSNITDSKEERDIFAAEEIPEIPATATTAEPKPLEKIEPKQKFGVVAISDFVLRVSLRQPDEDFPSLVAHPMFFPIQNAAEFENEKLNAAITTNGAFRIVSIGNDGVTLDRATTYWNKEKVLLDRVKFVPIENSEAALKAYRAGEVDVLSNFGFEPLALKLLEPFEDFRKHKFAAVNLYDFNTNREPFNDVKIREAFAISFDRKRITDDELDGSSQPALSFSPFGERKDFIENVTKAKRLMADAGFPNGDNFPIVRLLVNRNDAQKRIANALAKMWLRNLGVKSEIVIKGKDEFDAIHKSGEYDMVRRGVVLQTANEFTNLSAIFPPKILLDEESKSEEITANTNSNSVNSNSTTNSSANTNANIATNSQSSETAKLQNPKLVVDEPEQLILSEDQAAAEVPAIPLYFPETYSLVKPYVEGFETNILDAPSLKSVKINADWKR
jgi:oligopeptide transport system substrate-binding protein